MKKIRIAIIGCGRWANKVHYPTLASFEDVDVAAACDLDEARLAATADQYGIQGRFTDFRAMLDAVKPDGVYVVMPETVRFPVVKEVLSRGYPVFMEKPPARTTEEIRELAALAESKHLVNMVGTNRRFIPVLVESRRRMLERGTPELVVATYYKNEIPSTVTERRVYDVLVSDGIHAVDTMRWLASPFVGAQHAAPESVEVVSVRGRSQRLRASCDVTFEAIVEFANGCIGVLLLSWAAGNRYHAFEVHVGGATAFIVPDEGTRIVADGEKEPLWTMSSAARMGDDSVLGYGFLQENRHFIDCLRSGTPTLSPFSDAVKSMELIDLIKSACRCSEA